MYKCPSCGAHINDVSLGFCPVCGAYFSKAAEKSSSAAQVTPANAEDPLEKGIRLATIGALSEATANFMAAYRGKEGPSDADYERLLEAVNEGMINNTIPFREQLKANLPALDMALEGREFIPDLMRKLSGSLGVCKIQNGVLGLANSYIYTFIGAYAAYTDVRELKELSTEAASRLLEMEDKAKDLPNVMPGAKPDPMRCLAAYRDYANKLVEADRKIESSVSPEELERLVNAWTETHQAKYITHITNGFVYTLRLAMAEKFSTGTFMRRRAKELDAFVSEYLAGPKQS